MDSSLLRLSDIWVDIEGRQVLSSLSFSLHRGEILAIFGTFDTGKRVIMDVIEGRRIPADGHLFFEGKLLTPGSPPCKIKRISKVFSILDSLTVWENLFLTRRQTPAIALTNPRRDRQLAKVIMEDYAFEIDPDRAGSDLTDAEKLVVELLRAKMERVQLVLIDEFSIHASPEEQRMLKALMDRMAGEGITFLLAGYRLELLEFFAYRLLFLSHGHILYSIEAGGAGEDTIQKITRAMFPTAQYEGRRTALKTREVWSMSLPGTNGENYNIPFYGGQICYYLDPYSELIRCIRSFLGKTGYYTFTRKGLKRGWAGKGIRIAVIDHDIINMVFREMSAVENVCIGLPERFSNFGLTSAKISRFVGREFAAWTGNRDLSQKKICKTTTRQERIAISLYRLKMFRPQVLIILNLITELDLITEQMLKDTLAELAAGGTAVCGVSSDWEKVLPVADEYALVSGRKISRDISFTDIRQFAQLLRES